MNTRRIFIPQPGTELVLGKDWTFNVYLEGRNSAFIRAMGICFETKLPQYGANSQAVTLRAGTSMQLHDYSIRRGGFNLDSRVGFRVQIDGRSCPVWVHLDDANNIEAL
jgi:hypothetical protein